MQRRSSALFGVAMLLMSGVARAQSLDGAAAEALFQEAKKLADEGRYAEACPKFAESQRLDPGVGTLLYLGSCYEHAGRLASAWATFREAAEAARNQGRTDRATTADARAAALEPRLPRLRIDVAPDASVAGLQVLRDDIVLGDGTWGTPFPIDPGPHVIAARAPGYAPWETTLTSVEGSVATVEIPSLQLQREIPTQSAAAPVPERAAPPPAGATSAAPSGQRTASIVVWSVGGASLVAGAAFGLVAASQWSAAQDHCRAGTTPLRCDAAGLDQIDATRSSGLASTVLFAVGGAAAVAGTVLWFTAPTAEGGSSVALTLSPAGAHAIGAF